MADVPVPVLSVPPTFRRWAPVLAWMLVIFVASSRPGLPYQDDVPDWISHPVEYAVLSVLWCRAVSAGRPLDRRAAVLVVALCVAYGVSDEFHQSFVPHRHADPWDVVKDAAGAALGALAYARWSPSRLSPRAS